MSEKLSIECSYCNTVSMVLRGTDDGIGLLADCTHCGTIGAISDNRRDAIRTQELSAQKRRAEDDRHSIYNIDIKPKSGDPIMPINRKIIEVVEGLRKKVKVLEGEGESDEYIEEFKAECVTLRAENTYLKNTIQNIKDLLSTV